MKKRNNKKTKYIIKYVIIIILSIILCVGGIAGYKYYKSRIPIKSVDDLIKEKKKNNYQDSKEPVELPPYENKLPEYRQQYNNQEIQAKLEVPNMNIDTLVTRTSNNDYYLYYNLNNEYDELGVPFFDYRNTDLANNRQINIYGHNTQYEAVMDKLPFINFEAYIDKNIFDNYKTVYLSIDEKRIEYEVVAIKILTDGNPEHMRLVYKNDDEFVSHIEKMVSGSLYINDNFIVSKNDKYLVMQACHFNPPNSYLLVICREKA